jgi:tRNA nucleotidyltransferase/poly(A) polymerase
LKKKHKKRKVPNNSIVNGSRLEYFIERINEKFLLNSKKIVQLIDFPSLISIFNLAFTDHTIDIEAAVQLYDLCYLKIQELERDLELCSISNQITLEDISRKGVECDAIIQIGMQLIVKLIQHYKEEYNVYKKQKYYAYFLAVVEQIMIVCEEDAIRHLLLAEHINKYYDDALSCYEVACSRHLALRMIENVISEIICENEAGNGLLSILKHKCLMYEIFSKLILIQIKLNVNPVDARTDCIFLENIIDSLNKDKIETSLMKKYKHIKKRCDMLELYDTKTTITVVDEQSTEKTCPLELQSDKKKSVEPIHLSEQYSRPAGLAGMLVVSSPMCKTDFSIYFSLNSNLGYFLEMRKQFEFEKEFITAQTRGTKNKKMLSEYMIYDKIQDTSKQEILRLTTSVVKQSQYVTILQYPVKKPQRVLHMLVPQSINEVLHSFRREGYYALIVGGAVRDLLMGLPFSDVDIITNMPTDGLLTHFKENSISQIRHISGLHQMKYAGIKFDITHCSTNIFISWQAFLADARTRAFTINALYCDFYGNIHDPLQCGLHDLLHKQTLRLIQHDFFRFGQDPSLLLRSVRLIVKYGLNLSLALEQSIQYFSGLLKVLDPQHLHLEIKKIFLQGYAVKSFNYFIRLDLFQSIYPKASLFLKSAQGEPYKKWIYQELERTDQLVINNKNASIAYVYALFLCGEVLAILEPSFEDIFINITQTINQVVEKSLQKIFHIEYLEKIKKIISTYVLQFVPDISRMCPTKSLFIQNTHIPPQAVSPSYLIQYRRMPRFNDFHTIEQHVYHNTIAKKDSMYMYRKCSQNVNSTLLLPYFNFSSQFSPTTLKMKSLKDQLHRTPAEKSATLLKKCAKDC